MHRLQKIIQCLSPVLLVFCFLVSTDAPAQILETVSASTRIPLPGMGPSYRKSVPFASSYKRGTIIVRPTEQALYLLTDKNTALRYRISVGRQGFGWSGTTTIASKKTWPEWRPPSEMRKRDPRLPTSVPPGPYNPLGARALYLYSGGKDTLYRIHGTNNPNGIGFDGTSGCFRLTNTDVVDLFKRVPIGTKVVVEN